MGNYYNSIINDTDVNPGGGIYKDLPSLLGLILNLMMGVSISISVLAIILSGVKFVVSQGDAKALDQARKYLTVAVLAFIVAISGFLVKTIILNLLGANQESLKNSVPTYD